MSGKFSYIEGLSRIYSKSDSSSVLKTLGPTSTVVILTLRPRIQVCESGQEREHEMENARECVRMCA